MTDNQGKEIPRAILKKYKEEYENGENDIKNIIGNFKKIGYKLTQKKFKNLIEDIGDSGSEHETLEENENNENNEDDEEEEAKTNEEEEAKTNDNNIIEQNNSLIEDLNVDKAQSEQIEYEVEAPKITLEERPKPIQYVEYKPTKSEKNNYSFVRNIDANNVDELKEKRTYIIIIRQYVNTFPEQLKFLYATDKKKFEKSLFNLSLDKLKIILENIRVELNLYKNKTLFLDGCKFLLTSYENVACYSGFNIKGLSDDLMNDPDFLYDLQMISCEIDVSKYINPKTSAFFKVVHKSYEKYEINIGIDKLKKNFDIDALNKLKSMK